MTTFCSSQLPNCSQQRSASATLEEHWVREQPAAWAQARQAWGWRARMGMSFCLRSLFRASLLVVITMPSATGVLQAGWGSAVPASSTTHRPQPPSSSSWAFSILTPPCHTAGAGFLPLPGGRSGWLQMVGM